jgi:radial spoke head protein 9
LDIFEPITKDEPKGCWSLTMENGGQVAMLRNFLWPGYLAFHSLDSNRFGDIYLGTGQKNFDIGFMI